MTDWAELEQELDIWRSENRIATFWWRDDDLVAPTPALGRLLQLRQHFDIPLSIAIIPNSTDSSLAHELDNCSVLQHGFQHKNYAAAGMKKSEFPDTRPLAEALEELVEGKNTLSAMFGDQFLPILVPPWNRIDENIVPELVDIGFIGLSRYSARKTVFAVPGIAQVNTHVDPINWRGNRSTVDQNTLLEMVLVHLRARRLNQVDALEPTGLLTHHLVHDEDIWAELFRLLSFLCMHPAVRWIPLQAAFALIDAIDEDVILPQME